MPNIAVIGSLWGDEGKGRTVDYFAKWFVKKGFNPLNVRFSGSNNAAHTVMLDEKTKHVFHLLGAGSFRNIPTYLSRHVVVDIVALASEIDEFKTKCPEYNSTVYVDPRCRLCLPYDVVLNRLKETIRSDSRHGSTGNGLNECINRHQFAPVTLYECNFGIYELTKAHLYYLDEIAHILRNVDMSILPDDLIELVDFYSRKNSIKIIHDKINELIKHPNIKIQRVNLLEYDVIFEGSQGLLLDEYSDHFPHVTRTRTGTTNIIDICREFYIEVDDIYYVARPYFSRHGRDEFFDDNSEAVLEKFNIVDETNIHNDWQESMYFDFFNFEVYENTINKDFNVFKSLYPKTRDNRVFTCIDQIINHYKDTYTYDEHIQSHKNHLESKLKHINRYINSIYMFDSPIN